MSRRGGIFVGFMFLGLGIGMLFGNAGAGVIIGMGVGFILSELFERRGAIEYEEVKKRIKRNYGIRLASGLLGILFIFIGVMLALYPGALEILIQEFGYYIGAVIILLLGIFFLLSALSREGSKDNLRKND